MILFYGIPGDTPLAMVQAELIRQGHATTLVDQRSVLDTEADVTFGTEVEGTIRIGQQVIDLSDVTAVYLRSYGLEQLPALQSVDRRGPEWRHAVNVESSVALWPVSCVILPAHKQR